MEENMKKKISYEDIMYEIIDSLEKEGLLPNHLDYVSVGKYDDFSKVKITNLESERLELKYSLDYGGSEGIYLDVEAYDFRYPDSDKWVNVLTIKTLNTDDSSMADMAGIIGNISIKFRKFIDDNWELLSRVGYRIYGKKDKNDKCGISSMVLSKDKIQETLEKMMKNYPSFNYFEIIDQDSLEVIEIVERKQ